MPHAAGCLLSKMLLVLTTYTVRVPLTPTTMSGTGGGFIEAPVFLEATRPLPVRTRTTAANRRLTKDIRNFIPTSWRDSCDVA